MSAGNVNSLVALLKSGSISKGELLAKMSSGGKPPGPPPRPQQKTQDQVLHSPVRHPSNTELYPPEPTTPEEDEPFEEDEEDAQRRDSFDDLDDELPLPPLAEVSQESDLSSRIGAGVGAGVHVQSAAIYAETIGTSNYNHAQGPAHHHSMEAYDHTRPSEATHAATAEAAAHTAALVADAALSAPMTGNAGKDATGTVSGFSGAERQSMISTILQHKASPEAHGRRANDSEALQPPPTWSSTEAEEWNGPPQGLRSVPMGDPSSISSQAQPNQHSTNGKPAHSFANGGNSSSSSGSGVGGRGSFAAPTAAWSARAMPPEPTPPPLRQATATAGVSPRAPRGSSGGGNSNSFDRGGGVPVANNNTSASSSGSSAFDHLPPNNHHHDDSGRGGNPNGLSIDTSLEGGGSVGGNPDSARSSADGASLRRRGSNHGVHGPERLYSQAGAIAEKKRAFVERLKAEEESRYREACTFTPNIPKSSVKLAKTVKTVLQGPPAAQPPPKSVVVPASGLGFHFAAPTAAWAHSRAPAAPPDDPPIAPPSAYRDKREQQRAAQQQQQQAQQAQESSWHLQPALSPTRGRSSGGAGGAAGLNAASNAPPPPPPNQPNRPSASVPERFAAADVFSDEAAPYAPDQWSHLNSEGLDASCSGSASGLPSAPLSQQQQQQRRGAPASSSSSTAAAAKAAARAHDDERDGWLRAAMQHAHGNGDSSMAWAKAQATELAGHCTFTPTTNKINPSAMPTASRYVESPVVERLTRNTQGPPPKSRLQRAHGGNEAHSGSGNGSGPGEASDLLHTPAPTNHHASDNKRGGPPPSFMFGRTYHRPDPNQNASNSQNTSQGSGTQMLSSSNYGSAHQAHDSRAAANNNDGHVPPVARKFGPFAAQPPPQLQPPSNRGGSNHRELLNASDVSTSLLDAYPGSYPGTPPLPEGAYASNNDQRNDDSDVSRDASHEEESNDDEGNLEGQAPTAPTQEEVNQATNAAAAAAGAAVPFAPTRAFHEMMTRQAQHLARSAENARRLAQQATPSFQPNINAKSSHLVAESGRGSFEQRLAVDVLERHGSHSRASQERGPSSRSRSRSNSHHSAYGAWPANDVNNSAYGQPSFEQQQQAYYYNEQQSESGYGRGSGSSLLYDYPEPPSQVMSIGQVMKLAAQNGGTSLSGDRGASNQHTPAITAKAAALRARSFGEMSLGDARKREAAVRKAMARAAEDEERTFTGRPRLTTKAVKDESKLRLGSAEDAATYAQRIANAAAQRQAKLDLLKAQALEKEEAGCTFEPLVRACPSKVARMANAHRARQQKASAQGGSRQGSGGSNGRPRPDWK